MLMTCLTMYCFSACMVFNQADKYLQCCPSVKAEILGVRKLKIVAGILASRHRVKSSYILRMFHQNIIRTRHLSFVATLR